jgi:hypothetical protein
MPKQLQPVPESTPAMIKAEDIITPAELASRLKVDLSWIYEKSRKGGRHGKPLPVLRCGRYLRFCWTDIVAWLRQNQTP